MIKETVALIFFVVLTVTMVMNPIAVFSQETVPETSPDAAPEPPGEEPPAEAGTADESAAVYYIRTITFDSIGRSRPFALSKVLDLEEGHQVTGKAALEALISRKTQDLRNERVLKDEETRIGYTLGEAGEDGRFPVDLLVHTEDSWNIIGLPQPRFTSGSGESSGFRVILKTRDYNFLGTMKPLKVNVGVEYNTEKTRTDGTKYKQLSIPWDIDADIPFTFLGKLWNFNFDNLFNYQNNDDPFQYTNVTGLSVDLPWKQTTITVGFNQSFILNEKNSDEEKDVTGDPFFTDKWYMDSELYAKWEIPFGIEVGNFGELIYKANLTESLKYRPGGDIGKYRRGPATIFSHNIEFGKIDWIGNFRKGLNVSVNNSIVFNEYNLVNGNGAGKEDWDVIWGPTVIVHFLPLKFFGIYGHLGFTQRIKTPVYPIEFYGVDVGTYLRGISDDKLVAKQLLYFNLELPLGIPRFTPSKWFNRRFFKPFNFEFHFSPFIDLALMNGGEKRTPANPTPLYYGFGDILATAGLELFVYSLSWRSLYFRFSFGWDLREWYRTGETPGFLDAEIFMGMERFF